MSALLRRISAASATLYMDQDRVFLDDSAPSDIREEVVDQQEALALAITPSVTDEQRRTVAAILDGLDVVLIEDESDAAGAVRELLADADRSGCIALDTETAVMPECRQPRAIAITKDGRIAVRQPTHGSAGYALDPRRARVRLLQCYGGGSCVYVFDMAEISWSAVVDLFQRPLAIFNAMFDVRMILASGGPEPSVRIYDVMTAMRLVNGSRPSLATACADVLGLQLPKTLGASDWSGSLTADQINYAAADPLMAFLLWQQQRTTFDAADENAQEIVDEAIIAVARMELAGIPLDTGRHREMIADWRTSFQASLDQLRERTGITGRGLPTNAQISAYLQLALTPDRLEAWPRTEKTGSLSVSATTLRIRGGDVPGIPELLTARRWAKAISTYGDDLLHRVDDGRLYAGLLIAGARTGRASSRSPNLQNMPARSQELATFRTIFKAPAGRVIVAADYSQIELRELAAQSGDPVMTGLYRAYGRVHRDPDARKAYDIHTQTARAFSTHDEPTKAERSIAKAINFSLSYGAGPKGVAAYAKSAYGIDLSREEAVEKIQAFRDTYTGVAQWQAEQEAHTRGCGYVSTLGGRRWPWEWRSHELEDDGADDLEEWAIDDWLEGYERNYALNHPIQGTCAEIVWLALAYVDRALRNYSARIVAVVHDEIVVEAADSPETIRAVRRILVTCMTRSWLEFHPEAPWRGLVDIGVGPTWADAH